ncbi:MAG: phytanoyl-CoA dioxygenase family protein [Actinomycetia bacterium]|nr:phytanoyl-CoA dioxygenase family protein [Actinomycetes bacterium]MCP5035657.1 phytanoyl-CoA dioxygenase family protein [Actinomycetes bacterium]
MAMTTATEGGFGAETRLLSDEQKAFYDRSGYLQLESLVGTEWLTALRSAAQEFVERSRTQTESDRVLDLEPTHSADNPRLRRLVSPLDHHETFHRFSTGGPPAQLAIELLGNPVRFHHSKLNYKWSDGGEEVKWHQDIQFWPHTDFSPLTIGVYLEDVDAEMGPMGVLPGSHRGVIYDQYRSDGSWAGAMNDADVATIDFDQVVWLQGPAGSVTIHNGAMVHGSAPNQSPRSRPLLLQTYSAANSYPIAGIGANGATGPNGGLMIGGAADQRVEIEGRAMHGAPNWSRQGPPTIFGSQQGDAKNDG